MDLKKDKLNKAKGKLKEILSFDRIKKMPKYRNFNMEQYLLLIDNIESYCKIFFESYIITKLDYDE